MKSVLASYTLSLRFLSRSAVDGGQVWNPPVFACAIGSHTGSFLCGISSNIHLLVVCDCCKAAAGP